MEKKFNEYVESRNGGDHAKIISEASHTSSYSIEVNYRSEISEVLDAFAKLCLGYVSASLKRCGYHCKTIFSAKPYRVLVGTRDWDDGEWVAMAVFNHGEGKFVIAEGSYNKDKKSVSIHRSRKTDHKNAAEIVKDLRNLLEDLKRRNPVRSSSLVPVPLKRGPKPRGQKAMKKFTSMIQRRR